MAGESLFNDGVGVAVFLGLLEIVTEGSAFSPLGLTVVFLKEAVGGVVFGLVLGLLAYALLKSVDNYPVEILVSLATAAGGYALADALHVSRQSPWSWPVFSSGITGRLRHVAQDGRTSGSVLGVSG